jgi:hypothetical protein
MPWRIVSKQAVFDFVLFGVGCTKTKITIQNELEDAISKATYTLLMFGDAFRICFQASLAASCARSKARQGSATFLV